MRTLGLLVTSVLVWSVLAQSEGPDVEWETNNDDFLRFPIEPAEKGAEPDPSFVQPLSRAEDISQHIINGKATRYGDHPYICALHVRYRSYWYFVGGAVIYNQNTVMTAAHCVEGLKVSKLRVRCGDFHLTKTDKYEQIRAITKITMHRRWDGVNNRGHYSNDIALLKVQTSLNFNDYVNTLPIATSATPLPNRNCQLVGWGRTENGTASIELREVTIKRISRKKCMKTYSNLINNGHLCFLDIGEPDSACTGDQGGPAVCGDYLVGLSSWGVHGCVHGYPSVYTRLAKYKRWVDNNSF